MLRSLLLLLGLLATAGAATAQTAAPVDTLPGHAQLVRHISASLCTQMQAYSAAQLQRLSEAEAQQLVQQLMTKAMLSDSTALLGLVQRAQQQGREPRQVGEKLGYDATIQLARECPAALPLITRIGLTEQAQQAAAANPPDLSPTDKQALQPLATGICSQLAAANTKKSFTSLTPAERKTRFSAAFQQQFAANRTQLLHHYKASQLADEQFMRKLGESVARLMLTQAACGQYIMQLGADKLNGQPPAAKP